MAHTVNMNEWPRESCVWPLVNSSLFFSHSLFSILYWDHRVRSMTTNNNNTVSFSCPPEVVSGVRVRVCALHVHVTNCARTRYYCQENCHYHCWLLTTGHCYWHIVVVVIIRMLAIFRVFSRSRALAFSHSRMFACLARWHNNNNSPTCPRRVLCLHCAIIISIQARQSQVCANVARHKLVVCCLVRSKRLLCDCRLLFSYAPLMSRYMLCISSEW